MDPHRPAIAPDPADDAPPELPARLPACRSCGGAVEPDEPRCPACNTHRPAEGWPPDPRIGTTILDGLELRDRLGYGATGSVYLGVRPGGDDEVAVKLLRRDLTADPELVRRFRLEAVVTRSLAIPQVVAARDFGVLDDGTHYLAMERVHGVGLDRVLQARPRLRIDVALEIARQVLVALAVTHQRGVVHRDLKPGNLVVGRDDAGQPLVRILDFGFAKVLADPDLAPALRLTQGLTVMGTPQYMSPEQCRGSRAVDGRSDLYSLGVILYRMLTGVVPFDGNSGAEILQRQLDHRPDPPSARWPDIPPGLDRVVLWMLEKDPEARPATAGAVLDALAPHLAAHDTDGEVRRAAQAAGRRSEMLRQIDRHVATGDAIPAIPVAQGPATALGPEAPPEAPARPARSGVAWKVVLALLVAAGIAAVAWWGLRGG